MTAAHPARAQADDLRFNLVLPVTRVGFGPFSFDPLEKLIGCSVESILASLMTGPKQLRPAPGSAGVEVYPLRLPRGEGALIPLKHLGELGFKNEAGLLRITVPVQAGRWLAERLGDALVRGPEDGWSVDRQGRVQHVWTRLKPGMRAGYPVGGYGELGVEVGG